MGHVAEALNKGDLALASISLVHAELPPLPSSKHARAMAKADGLVTRYNKDWQDEPRVPKGNPDGGQWTNDDGGIGSNSARVEPVSDRSGRKGKKKRFVDAHLADAQKVANQLKVPVENILGVSAVESNWGESRFAVQGNNFFGIHYPAPFAAGYMAAQSGVKVAIFASYADSLRSFVAIAGADVQGLTDPHDFAAASSESATPATLTKSAQRSKDFGQLSRTTISRTGKQVFSLGLAVVVLGLALNCPGAGLAMELLPRIDEATAQRLVAEAYGRGANPDWFDFDPGMSHRFFEFDGVNQSSNGSFGFFAVNPWTGDVWALWGCHKLSTAALRKSQAEIRRHFPPRDLKRYDRLSALKPDCVVDD